MTPEEFVARLGPNARPKVTSSGWSCRCPAHDDNNPSLSVSRGTHGGVLVHCHGGCSPEAICEAAGVRLADLTPRKPTSEFTRLPERKGPNRQPTATYDYRNERGELVFQVCRYADPKDFRQRRPDGKGGWTWKTQGIRRVLYRLPEVIRAIKGGGIVYIAEGEKDVDALCRAGAVATCNPGGAGKGKWLAEFTESLRGANVVILPDKDEPGRNHGAAVADALCSVAASVKLIELPGPGKDAADWIDAGGSLEALDELAQAAPEWSPVQITPVPWLEIIEEGSRIIVEELPEIREIVDGILPEESKLLIGSGSKSFKTWLTIDLSVSISHGVPFLGRETIRTRVLYVNLELKPLTFKRRIQAIAKAKGITIEPHQFIHLPLRGKIAGLKVQEIIGRVIQLAKHLAAGVVVIDPVYKLNTEGDENSSRDQTVLFNLIDTITTEAGCTVILNDHFGKGNQSEKDPLDTIRGSSAKGGDVDAAMVLRRHEVHECFRVDMVHRELPPVEPFVIGWQFPLMRLRDDLEPDDMRKPKGGRHKAHDPEELCAAISDTTAENPISISKWAALAKIPRGTLQEYLDGLRKRGWIATAGEGSSARQYLTEAGKRAAQRVKEAA